jgi:hypothetical protein
MNLLIYTYIDNETNVEKTIFIKLNDTPFVKYWIDYLLRLTEKVPKVDWYSAILNSTKYEGRPANENVPPLVDLLLTFVYFQRINIMEKFDDIVTELKTLVINPQLVEQTHLNKWHRIFTRLEHKYLKLEAPMDQQINKTEFWQYVQDINTFTHKLETYTYPREERRIPYLGQCQYSIQFTNANNLNYIKAGIFDEQNIERIPKEFVFDIKTDNFDYDVWLHEDITGKDQMKAWLDRDNLNEFDITGNILMTPSITLDPHRIYPSILKTEEFRIESVASNKPVNRYPLGIIINKDKIDWEKFINCKVTKIRLNDKVLWN